MVLLCVLRYKHIVGIAVVVSLPMPSVMPGHFLFRVSSQLMCLGKLLTFLNRFHTPMPAPSKSHLFYLLVRGSNDATVSSRLARKLENLSEKVEGTG